MNKTKKVLEVVAALIVKDGKILATQRGYGEFKGKWEFPGGKIEENELDEPALIREIKEELNADINIIDFLKTIQYDYPKFYLVMHTYICTLNNDIEFVKHNEKELEHENMIWLDKTELDSLDWLPADIEAVKEYKKLRRIS
jgi:8-oxo-dGTP diphosphatase